jgi:hypothetical protein
MDYLEERIIADIRRYADVMVPANAPEPAENLDRLIDCVKREMEMCRFRYSQQRKNDRYR